MRAQSIRELVVLFPGALGDLLLAAPALRAVRRRHAGAHATAVVSDPLRGLAVAAGIADDAVSVDGRDTTWLFGGTHRPAWLARRPLVYSALGARDDGVAGRLEEVADGVHVFRVVREPGPVHATRAYADALDVCVDEEGMLVPPASARAGALLASLARPVLVIHPGAGAPAKRWASAGFEELARRWRVGGGSVVTLIGPAETGVALATGEPRAEGWPLLDVAALLAGATVYVGNDSGVSHLAGAVGAHGAVLFGPTEPQRWRPPGALTVLRGAGDVLDLDALPIARVEAACRRWLTLTRGNPDTSVPTVSTARLNK